MMNFFRENKIGIITTLAIILGLFVYGMFFRSPAQVSPPQTPLVGQKILQSLDTLRGISLDSSLLQNPIFSGLTDYTTEVVIEPRGRANPFAQIGQ